MCIKNPGLSGFGLLGLKALSTQKHPLDLRSLSQLSHKKFSPNNMF